MVSDGGVAGTHPPSTLHFFVGDECVLIGVGSALMSAPILPRGVLGVPGRAKSGPRKYRYRPARNFDRYRTGPKSRHQIWDEPFEGDAARARREDPPVASWRPGGRGMPSIRLSRSGGSRSSGRCSASAPRRGLRTAPMSAGTAGLFSRKTPGTREPWTARRTRGRTCLSARSGRARRGGFRRRSGPGTWAASSSTSSRRWRPSERSERGGSPSASPWRISSPNDARRSAMARRPRPRAPSPRPSAPATARTSAWTPRRRRAAEAGASISSASRDPTRRPTPRNTTTITAPCSPPRRRRSGRGPR